MKPPPKPSGETLPTNEPLDEPLDEDRSPRSRRERAHAHDARRRRLPAVTLRPPAAPDSGAGLVAADLFAAGLVAADLFAAGLLAADLLAAGSSATAL
jgi:hypothetical protein